MAENGKKSMLVPVGFILLLVGILMPGSVDLAARAGRSATGQLDPVARAFCEISDLLRLCFYVGIGCLIIGYLRNQKLVAAEKAREAGKLVDDGTTWKCPKCAHENPNNTYCCLKCGFSLV